MLAGGFVACIPISKKYDNKKAKMKKISRTGNCAIAKNRWWHRPTSARHAVGGKSLRRQIRLCLVAVQSKHLMSRDIVWYTCTSLVICSLKSFIGMLPRGESTNLAYPDISIQSFHQVETHGAGRLLGDTRKRLVGEIYFKCNVIREYKKNKRFKENLQTLQSVKKKTIKKI